jgi:hypothetical protein
MRIRILRVTTLFLLVFVFFACKQDPIFYTISQEVAPRDPRIPGGPVNFTVFTRAGDGGKTLLYAASGKKLHWYAGTGWDNRNWGVPQPGGWIKYLAATGDFLFAICYPGDSGLKAPALKRIAADGNEWAALELEDDAKNYPFFQTVYAPSPQWVFIGSVIRSNNNSFVILYANGAQDGDKVIRVLKDNGLILDDGLLCGAAFYNGDYYLCTETGVVYAVPETLLSAGAGTVKKLSAGTRLKGIITLEGADPAAPPVVAMSRGGKLYNVTAADAEGKIPAAVDASGKELSMGDYATGALALWKEVTAENDESGKTLLLLAGKQDSFTYSTSSGYTYGYREFKITADGIEQPREPGGTYPTSADNNERYRSTIGKHQVNFIFQAPYKVDTAMPLFAATEKDGVWSYRERDGTWQWNAE